MYLQEEAKVRVLAALDRLLDDVENSILVCRLPELVLNCSKRVLRTQNAYIDVDSACGTSRYSVRYGDRRFGTTSFSNRVQVLTQQAVMLAVISIIYEALSTSVTVTKRDIYYRNVPLFGSQQIVDEALSRLTAHLQVARHQLNVRAAAKGLARGPLSLMLNDGSIIDCDSSNYLIADIEDYRSITLDKCDAVLVVEKEAVFQTLASQSFHRSRDFRCLLVTGKGYPDLYTRRFVHLIEKHIQSSPAVLTRLTPILCLVDADPHGFEIMATYKYGSKAMVNECQNLAVKSLKWLGIHSQDYSNDCEGLLPFTSVDKKKLASLLNQEYLTRKNIAPAWTEELRKMSVRQKKAEIEVLAVTHGQSFVDVLRQKITSSKWL